MGKRLKLALLVALTVATTGLWSFTSLAADPPQGYPARKIEIVNPFKAGGSTDLYLRTLMVPMEKALGTKVVILNEEGGEGVRAFKEIESRPADGYTLYAIGPEEIINSVYERVDYQALTPLVRVQMDQSMYWVMEDSPFKTFSDMVTYAKANPNKVVIGASYGIDQVVTSLLFSSAGIQLKYVPYSVGKEATAALLGGHVDLLHEEPGGIISQIQAKMVRPLIVLTEHRLSSFPDTPTAVELGYDITIGRWRGLAVKKGTPMEIVNYLAAVVKEAMNTPEYQKLAEKTMMNLRPGFLGPQDFEAFLNKEFVTYDREMRNLGMVK